MRHAIALGRALLLVGCVADLSHAQTAAPLILESPDQRIRVRITVADRLSYAIDVDDRAITGACTLSMRIDQQVLGAAPRLLKSTARRHDGVVEPPVRQKAARLRDHYNEVRLDFDGQYAVVFRAYDEGVAYRFETSLAEADVTVVAEDATFAFAADFPVYYPEEQSFFSHNERHYLPRALSDLAAKNIASLPAVVDARDVKVAIAESDVEHYPGLWLRGTGGRALAATFPPYALDETLTRDRDLRVTTAADYIARTSGTRTYPWRILGIAHDDGALITNALVYLLASPSRVADTSWIRPGKVAWDWWNANNIFGVDFAAGLNTATYRHYIDFAAANGLQYVILDEGWYRLGNVLDVVPEIDVAGLTAYAKGKGVGIILWVVWNTLDAQLIPALDQFERWGVQGIKVDFMQRDDQKVIDYYHRISAEAAKRKMLVDFHGNQKPALMTRTWPNLITTEGVRGLEWAKWSAHAHPDHDATLPFTRMFLGPMDYTPGAMINAPQKDFAVVFNRPMSQGTRAHQLALYVIFESPLQMLADSPSNYRPETASMGFLSAVPTTWDETRVLEGRIGDYVVLARRSGREWYIGAITDWTPREFTLDLSFLPSGTFTLESHADGPNASRRGEDVSTATQRVTASSKVTIALAPGGGYAARIRP